MEFKNKWHTVPRGILLYWMRWIDWIEKILSDCKFPFNKELLDIKKMEELAKWEGIIVKLSKGVPENFKAELYRTNDKIVLLINGNRSNRAQWFMFGHELGHHFQLIFSNMDLNYIGRSEKEYQADVFAYHCFIHDKMMNDSFISYEVLNEMIKLHREYPDKAIQKEEELKEHTVPQIYKYSMDYIISLDPDDKPGGNTESSVEIFANFMFEWYMFRKKAKEGIYHDIEELKGVYLREALVRD